MLSDRSGAQGVEGPAVALPAASIARISGAPPSPRPCFCRQGGPPPNQPCPILSAFCAERVGKQAPNPAPTSDLISATAARVPHSSRSLTARRMGKHVSLPGNVILSGAPQGPHEQFHRSWGRRSEEPDVALGRVARVPAPQVNPATTMGAPGPGSPRTGLRSWGGGACVRTRDSTPLHQPRPNSAISATSDREPERTGRGHQHSSQNLARAPSQHCKKFRRPGAQ